MNSPPGAWMIEIERRLSELARRSANRFTEIQIVDTDGVTRTLIGSQPDGTVAMSSFGGDAPAAPSAPGVTSAIGGFRVTWDGQLVTATAPLPASFTAVEVHVAQVIPMAGDATTRAGELAVGSGLTISATPGTWYIGLRARSNSGVLSVMSDYVSITVESLDDMAGTKVWYGDDPTGDQANVVHNGDLWVKYPERISYRRINDAWAEERDQGITDALEQASAASDAALSAEDAAAAASNAAAGKTTHFDQAAQPPTSGRTVGDTWTDTDDGNKPYVWTSGGWTARRLGNASIEPGSLVASDVIATGTISAGLLTATAIDGKTITGALIRTAESGQRIQIDSASGVVGIGPTGVVNTQISPADGMLTAKGATIQGEIRTADTGARIRIFQQLAGSGMPARGTVSLFTGITGETAAGIVATSADSNRRQVFFTGGNLSGSGVTEPSVVMGVLPVSESAPTGTKKSTVDVYGTQVSIQGDDAVTIKSINGASGITFTRDSLGPRIESMPLRGRNFDRTRLYDGTDSDDRFVAINASGVMGAVSTRPHAKTFITDSGGNVQTDINYLNDNKANNGHTHDVAQVFTDGNNLSFRIRAFNGRTSVQSFNSAAYMEFYDDGRVVSYPIRSRDVSGYSNRVACWIGGDGTLGYNTSARKYKIGERSYDADLQALLAIEPKWYHRMDSQDDGEEAGFIADDFHDAGLTEFVVYNEEGEVDSLRYDQLTVALHHLIRHLDGRLVALEARS